MLDRPPVSSRDNDGTPGCGGFVLVTVVALLGALVGVQGWGERGGLRVVLWVGFPLIRGAGFPLQMLRITAVTPGSGIGGPDHPTVGRAT